MKCSICGKEASYVVGIDSLVFTGETFVYAGRCKKHIDAEEKIK